MNPHDRDKHASYCDWPTTSCSCCVHNDFRSDYEKEGDRLHGLARICRTVADFPPEALEDAQDKIDHESDLSQANRDSCVLHAFREFQRVIKRAMQEQAEADKREKLLSMTGGKQSVEYD